MWVETADQPLELAMSMIAGSQPRPASRPPSHRRRHGHGVQLSHRCLGSATVVTVIGEVDASNSREVAVYVRDRLGECEYLALDMEKVNFLGIPAFSTLHCVNVECAHRGIPWVMTPSREVSRVLGICDPESALPLATEVDAGLATLDRRSGPRYWLR
jgi:anti-anti-sigma factor